MINKQYETQVAMAEAYASAYCNARELTGMSPVWSGVRAGYLQALQDSKKEITDSERLDWLIEKRAWVQDYKETYAVVTIFASNTPKYFSNPRQAINDAIQAEKGKAE